MTNIQHVVMLTLALSPVSNFANQTATVMLADTILGNRVIEYELINDYAVVEGDIIIGKLSEMTTPTAIIKSTKIVNKNTVIIISKFCLDILFSIFKNL